MAPAYRYKTKRYTYPKNKARKQSNQLASIYKTKLYTYPKNKGRKHSNQLAYRYKTKHYTYPKNKARKQSNQLASIYKTKRYIYPKNKARKQSNQLAYRCKTKLYTCPKVVQENKAINFLIDVKQSVILTLKIKKVIQENKAILLTDINTKQQLIEVKKISNQLVSGWKKLYTYTERNKTEQSTCSYT